MLSGSNGLGEPFADGSAKKVKLIAIAHGTLPYRTVRMAAARRVRDLPNMVKLTAHIVPFRLTPRNARPCASYARSSAVFLCKVCRRFGLALGDVRWCPIGS